MNDMTTQALNMFFKHAKLIDLEYRALEKTKQHPFNVFSILFPDKIHYEEHLHSRFLAELLNPEGVHLYEHEFQSLFIEKIVACRSKHINLNKNFECHREYFTGFGRIDFCLKNTEQIIIIENKIYAGDQEAQLERYAKYAKSAGYKVEDTFIFYLTLHGSELSKQSCGKYSSDSFFCISYEDDIRQWLTQCIEKASLQPAVRETLLQYQHIVNKLTGNTLMEEKRSAYIKFLLKDSQNLRLAHELNQCFSDTQIAIQMKIWRNLEKALHTQGMEFDFVNFDLMKLDNLSERVEKYCKNNKKYFGLQKKIAQIDNLGIHCYIEIDNQMNFGLTLSENGVRKAIHAPQKITNTLSQLEAKFKQPDDWWLCWSEIENSIIKASIESYIPFVDENFQSEWSVKTAKCIQYFIEDACSLLKTLPDIELVS